MMNKKTILKLSLILGIIVVSLILVIFISGVFDQRIADGKYYIKNNSKYPDAYVEVNGNQIQFHNIDLNDIFLENMIGDYNRIIERKPERKVSDAEYEKQFDINNWLVEKPYTISYSDDANNKKGTFVYYYYLSNDFYFTVSVINYDSLHKTLTLQKGDIKCEFTK